MAEASSLNNVLIDDAARIPEQPIRPRVIQNTLLAAIVGLITGVGIIFLVDFFDDTVKGPEELERETGLSTLGKVVKFPVPEPQAALIAKHEPRSPTAEAYRRLRTNIQFVNIDNPLHTLLVTSAEAGEGKSTTSANLATVLAQTSERVILIDADWRRPNIHKIFGMPNSTGLTQVRLDPGLNLRHLRESSVKNLYVLTTGPLPPNQVELLGSERMRETLRKLSEKVDYVVLDTPPVLAVADALVLSSVVDGALLVVNEKTRLPAVLEATKQLKKVDAPLAGIMVNGIRRKGKLYGYYDYSYGYDAESVRGRKGKGRQ